MNLARRVRGLHNKDCSTTIGAHLTMSIMINETTLQMKVIVGANAVQTMNTLCLLGDRTIAHAE